MQTRYLKALSMANIPKRYKDTTVEGLAFKKSNAEAYRKIKKYCDSIYEYAIDKAYNMYLYSKPTKTNELGTGTGKTTSSIAILNEFIKQYIWNITKSGIGMTDLPAYFVKCATFQNTYNAQFKQNSGVEYQAMKSKMKSCKLLVIDDIAIRSCSEGFMTELYDVIDYRVSEMLSTIYTSNVSQDKISDVLDLRIQSRLYEDCIPVELTGEDNRF